MLFTFKDKWGKQIRLAYLGFSLLQHTSLSGGQLRDDPLGRKLVQHHLNLISSYDTSSLILSEGLGWSLKRKENIKFTWINHKTSYLRNQKHVCHLYLTDFLLDGTYLKVCLASRQSSTSWKNFQPPPVYQQTIDWWSWIDERSPISALFLAIRYNG